MIDIVLARYSASPSIYRTVGIVHLNVSVPLSNYFEIIIGNLKLNKNKNKILNLYIIKKGKTNVEDKFNNFKVKDKSLNINKINTDVSNNNQLNINNYNNNNNNTYNNFFFFFFFFFLKRKKNTLKKIY